MSYKNYGEISCEECDSIYQLAVMEDIGEDQGSLIFCPFCSKWTKWH